MSKRLTIAIGVGAALSFAGLAAIAQAPAGRGAGAQAQGGQASAAAAQAAAGPPGSVMAYLSQAPGPMGAPAQIRLQSAKNGIPQYEDIYATLDAIPTVAPAKPKKPRRVLVFARATGWMHSVIPLTAFAVKEMGERTGAWQTDVTYELSDFTAANLARYDVLFMDNTTGAFLDDADAAATAARKQALLDFVRGGKGLVGVHSATDSYHGRGANGPIGTWPEWNKLLGGFFVFHWGNPQEITVKIDDPKSPITAAFGGKPYVIHDETYTFDHAFSSPKNVHILTSIDYSKMSAADKAQEPAATRRDDGFYAMSWIRREGKGRVFYEGHGHSEHVLAMPAYLKELLAGIQYAAGDLAADDSPSAK